MAMLSCSLDVEGDNIKGQRLRIAFLQDEPGSGLQNHRARTLADARPQVIAFPEYYFVARKDDSVLSARSRTDEILSQLKAWSSEFHCLIVGGSLIIEEGNRMYNRCYLFNNGSNVGHYDKIHPLDREGQGRISPGTEYKVFEQAGARIGVLICADVLYPHSFSSIRGLRPDVIFVPTTSPYRRGESRRQKFSRDLNIFGAGAEISQAIIIKVSACGSIAGHRLQGRSLIASPGRILWRIEPEHEARSALTIVDLVCDPAKPLLDITVHFP